MTGTSNRSFPKAGLAFVGPALATGVAYIDPGNVATNLTGGARFGYALIWVIVFANIGAWLVQYLSAKLAIASGKSMAELLGSAIKKRWLRLLYWLQAEAMILATELAEIVGGAIALHLLFGLNPIFGAVIVGAAAFLILSLARQEKVGIFIAVVVGLMAVTIIGFVSSLFTSQIDAAALALGLVPQISERDELFLALGILGATIMPHAIYVHSALTAERFGKAKDDEKRRLLKWTRLDVSVAMGIAGIANIGILLVGAVTVAGDVEEVTIDSAVAHISEFHGQIFGTMFAIGLLASSLASSAVGGYAGASVMSGLTNLKVSARVRRLISIVPSVLILALVPDSTAVLVISQIALAFGLPLALGPLVWLTGQSKLMGKYVNRLRTKLLAGLLLAILVGLNAWSLLPIA
ncbi:Mn2+ and Fe2+ transporters of the NRAMP family [Rhodoluna lacicola]|uniref:Mn2+ and Fe2+ transporters of the NRAMP family n=1 Tax=Rhodoluna lacicola TaxID=529884 RepID=A0A060JEI5_9MICO|nr:Mn2+ and Fe2+ transporters of the NRAMP family [Rhodoluna lacicola]